MARYAFNGTFRAGSGPIVSDGTITVYLAGTTTLATIYASSTAVSAISGSAVTSASNGQFSFYVDDSDYAITQQFKLTMSKALFTTTTYDYVNVFASNLGALLPLSIANGGTGAQSAGGALVSLGGGATGISIFQASSAATVRTLADAQQDVMTTVGDIVYLSSAGVARLGIGSAGQFLKVVGGLPVWGAGAASPVTSEGDLVVGNASGDESRLAIGSSGYYLKSNGTTATWAAPILTARGDILTRNSSGETRLPVGTVGQVLSTDGTDLVWSDPGGGKWERVGDPVSASGDAAIAWTLSSSYDYSIEIDEALPSSDGANLIMQLGTSGPTYITTGVYNYSGATANIAGAVGTDAGQNATSFSLMPGVALGVIKNNITVGIFNIGSGEQPLIKRFCYGYANISIVGGGHCTETTEKAAVRILFSTGNIASGIFTLYRRARS